MFERIVCAGPAAGVATAAAVDDGAAACVRVLRARAQPLAERQARNGARAEWARASLDPQADTKAGHEKGRQMAVNSSGPMLTKS